MLVLWILELAEPEISPGFMTGYGHECLFVTWSYCVFHTTLTALDGIMAFHVFQKGPGRCITQKCPQSECVHCAAMSNAVGVQVFKLCTQCLWHSCTTIKCYQKWLRVMEICKYWPQLCFAGLTLTLVSVAHRTNYISSTLASPWRR